MMSICQPCRRGTARERLRGEGRRHGVPIANPRCRGRPAAIHRLRTARMCLPDMVRMLCQQGAPGRRGSGVQDLVNSTKQFYSFSRSASFITHKAHLDAAGVVHGPHALHLLVHHLREPPASPKIKKDRASRKTEHQERPETVRTGLAFGFSHRPSPRAQQQPRGPACRAPHLGGGAEGDDGGEHVDETDGLRLRGVAGFNFFECVRVCA